uniref:Uncharacterized protein n=1 Tax=Phaeomonas parva TaxID=124430 RepID=A0A7S1XRZ0_9STRA|mmetsp:Transcript_27764/g.88116  ORF Transcript_27764/g.88116 Transcript_27764/m.88116 type:complete len:1375 (+) Transcript_27764:1076-5200(+)
MKLAAQLFLVMCSKTIVENMYFWILNRVSAQSRAEITSAVSNKMLKLSPSGAGDKAGGQAVTTLVQMDASRIENVLAQLHVTWDGLLQIFGNIFLLLMLLGPSVASGLSILLFVVPLNLWSYQKLAKYRTAMLARTDERVRLTNEALSGVQVLKMQNWESAASAAVEKARRGELAELRKTSLLRAGLTALLTAAPALVTVAILSAYSATGVLEPSRVFTALSLLNNLRFPLMFYPTVLSSLAEGRSSLKRFNDFFNAEETEKTSYVAVEAPRDEAAARGGFLNGVGSGERKEHVLEVEPGSLFYWSPLSNATKTSDDGGAGGAPRPMLLRNVDVKAERGQVVGLVGTVGSGKSSLLAALAGEMRCARGGVTVRVSELQRRRGEPPMGVMLQQPWVPAGTIREIILAGRQPDAVFDESAYINALEGSGLVQDLATFPDGDGTLVASGGKSLSGGQRARVSLARALYSNSPVLLLDDPLAALDADVAAQVWRRGILDAARRQGRTVFISLNNPQLAAQCDQLVVMSRTSEAGAAPVCESVFAGEWKELDDGERDVASLEGRMDILHKDFRQGTSPALHASNLPEVLGNLVAPTAAIKPRLNATFLANGDGSGEGAKAGVATETLMRGDGGSKVSEQVEDMERGRVKLKVYAAYFKALGSVGSLGLMALAYVGANSCSVLLNYSISAWTGASVAGYPDVGMGPNMHRLRVVGCAALLAFGTFYRVRVTMRAGLRASGKMHTSLLGKVMDASMRWHFKQRRGTLLTNFSRDLDQVDQSLPGQLGMLVSCVIMITASMSAISSVTPSFALLAPLVAWSYVRTMNLFRAVARELKRLEPAVRAPVLTQVGEALAGVRVLRAHGGDSAVRDNIYRSLDKAASAQHMSKAADRWLSVRLETLGNCVVGAAALLAIFSTEGMARRGATGVVETARQAGLSGFSITTAMGVTGLLSWTVRTLAESESQMSAVERVLKTTDSAPSELEEVECASKKAGGGAAGAEGGSKLRCSEKDLVASGWPWTGAIEFRNVSFRYSPEGPLVLRNVSFSVAPGERVGVVGRTGSGKSTILAALFRLYPIESGEILVDGVNVRDVSIKTLRNALAIIPQDPYVFEGRTITENVQPQLALFAAGQSGDGGEAKPISDRVWKALEAAQLAKAVTSLPAGSDTVLANGGAPLSAGQIQLLCLARAFLQVLPPAAAPKAPTPAPPEVSAGEDLPRMRATTDSPEEAMLTPDATAAAAAVANAVAREPVPEAPAEAAPSAPLASSRRRILLMDEATSAVDVETEQMIARALERVANPKRPHATAAAAAAPAPARSGEGKQPAGDKLTVLAIAHRLATVIGSDKVLVMDAGEVVEYDAPNNLLNEPDSRLRALLEASRTA